MGSGSKPFLKSCSSFSIWRGQTGPEGVWNLTSAFPLWSMLEKMGSVSKPFWHNFGPFHFERGQVGSKGVWNVALALPLWSMLEKVGSGSKPFEIIWPFHFEKGQTGPKGVWNRTSAFPLWSILEKVGPGSKPFQKTFGPFHFESVHDNLGPHCSFQGCCWQAGVPTTRVVVGTWPSGGFPLEGPFYSCQTDEWAATIMRRSRSRGSSVLSEGKGQELHALLESFEFLDLRSDLQGQGRETDIM